MVLNAGIIPDEPLQETLDATQAVTNKIRAIRVELHEKFTDLVLGDSAPSKGNVDNIEFDEIIPQILLPESPQFILYQRDDHSWLLINYVPESSKVKAKMLHASCVGPLKRAFGDGRVSNEINISAHTEMCWRYIHKQHFDINPEELKSEHEKLKDLAIRDEEEARAAQILAQKEHRGRMLLGSGNSSGGTVSFPFSESALQSIANFNAGQSNYCRYKLDISTETVHLDEETSCQPDDLTTSIPSTLATFNLYRYKLDNQAHIIFAMCRPSALTLPIKERMLTASCKNGIVNTLSSNGVAIDQNMEIDDGDEMSESSLKNRVAPETKESTGFVRKARPPARRPQKNTGVKTAL